MRLAVLFATLVFLPLSVCAGEASAKRFLWVWIQNLDANNI